MKTLELRPALVVILLLGTAWSLVAQDNPPPARFSNGFERNEAGWFDGTLGALGTIMRQQSGFLNGGGYADGIGSSSGRFHARTTGMPCFTAPDQDCGGPSTDWGGFTSRFPRGGYVTELDIYFDVRWAAANPDRRFDWSSAVNSSFQPPTHRRDFVFNVGTQLPSDPNPRFLIRAGTNAFRHSSFPQQECIPLDPTCLPAGEILRSGWYKFRHTFRSGAFSTCPATRCLIVDFDVFQGNGGSQVFHHTINSANDPLTFVGGNRYGWLVNEEVIGLPIDNSLRMNRRRTHAARGDGHDLTAGLDVQFDFNVSTWVGGRYQDDEDDGFVDEVQITDNLGSTFRALRITSTTFASDPEDDQREIVTVSGTGIHGGSRVGFTLAYLEPTEVETGYIDLALTDGYTFKATVATTTTVSIK